MPSHFDVFLSHNSKDKPAVRELAKALQVRGLKVWLDEWELIPGQPWQEALEEIIQTTRSAAVLVGKDGLGPWENQEMRSCISEFVGRKLPVIPVLLADAPGRPVLPLFLKQFTWVDLRGGLTEQGLDRLEWGITGKKPDLQSAEASPPEDPAFTAYRAWASEQYRGLSLLGVGGGDVRMRFDEVYVPLRFNQRLDRVDGSKESADWLTEASQDLQVEEIFQAPQAAGHQVLILGHPGAGKTTALLKLLHLCLKDGPRSLGFADDTLIPVFLRLRRLTREDLEHDHPLADLLARELADVSGGTLPADLGEGLWQHGRLLLLLDGLDEIADETLRTKVCGALEWELRNGFRAVISCRFAGYGNRVHLGQRFLPLEVRPLDAEQCRKLVELWFREAPRALREYPEADARRAADRLQAALESPAFASQAWKVLVGSPLLLTLLCVIVLRGGQMPRHRVDFYDKSLRVLLERRNLARQEDAEPPAEPPLDAETALAVLRSLAWDLHREGRRDDLERLAAVDAIEERLKALSREGDGFQILDWLHREAGILVDTASREYGFLHLGLQEYLTALEIASRGEELLDHPQVQWAEEWWQEVLLLLVGLPGRRLFAPLMKRLLALPATQERLLRTCLEEAAEVDLEPFLACLDPGQLPERQACVLRLLLGQTDPRLLAAATALQESPDPNVAALAERALVETSRSRAASAREVPELVLLSHPGDQEAASALAAHLGQAGMRVVVADPEHLADEIFAARSVAVLWGPGRQAAWEVKELQRALRVFARRNPAHLALRLPGSGAPLPLPADWKGETWLDLGNQLTPDCVTVVRRALAGKRPALSDQAPFFRAEEAFVDPLTGIRFLWIPGGRFQMGGHTYSHEQPIHWVRISPFWLGETPVTNQQYAVFLKNTGAMEPAYWRDPRFSASSDKPVVGVSWTDATEFCQWLSETLGQKVLLPSEAQWEFAARGTDGREYPWGDENPSPTLACYYAEQPASVGSCPAGKGPFGTLDQAGNVWEWCRDAWDEETYAKRSGEPVDPMEGERLKGDEVRRVLRGGGWFGPPELLRAAYRRRDPAGRRHLGIGFRVAAAPAT